MAEAQAAELSRNSLKLPSADPQPECNYMGPPTLYARQTKGKTQAEGLRLDGRAIAVAEAGRRRRERTAAACMIARPLEWILRNGY